MAVIVFVYICVEPYIKTILYRQIGLLLLLLLLLFSDEEPHLDASILTCTGMFVYVITTAHRQTTSTSEASSIVYCSLLIMAISCMERSGYSDDNG